LKGLIGKCKNCNKEVKLLDIQIKLIY